MNDHATHLRIWADTTNAQVSKFNGPLHEKFVRDHVIFTNIAKINQAMPNSKDVFKWVVNQITLEETTDEINSIAYLLLEKNCHISRSQIIASTELYNFDQRSLLPFIERINQCEPIQYIIGTQDFFGRPFTVDPSVLIPRPETELLVSTVIDFVKNSPFDNIRILDIGSGSGCIPITLSLEMKNVTGVGIDNSESALECAERNNKLHGTSIRFLLSDILSDTLPEGTFDVVVSNPPYITESEKSEMSDNVLKYEPPSALFVPNDEPLKFYTAIAKKGKLILNHGGLLAMEINEKYGDEVKQLLMEESYQVITIIKDLAGKDRIIKAFNQS